jgi:hypothetical protein
MKTTLEQTPTVSPSAVREGGKNCKCKERGRVPAPVLPADPEATVTAWLHPLEAPLAPAGDRRSLAEGAAAMVRVAEEEECGPDCGCRKKK